jgi:hypothetical protein
MIYEKLMEAESYISDLLQEKKDIGDHIDLLQTETG